MLTHGLESAIQKGFAQYQTYVYGGGGVGRIPCPKGSFIIITDYDYFYFLDPVGTIPGAPAVEFVGWIFAPLTIYSFTWTFMGVPSPIFLVDPSAPAGFVATFQAFLNANFPGFTIAVSFPALTTIQLTITSSSPGTAFNGLLPVTTLAPGSIGFFSSTFEGGTNNSATLDEVKRASTHQLEFRSLKSRNHFLIREDYEIFSWEQIGIAPDNNFFYNVNGYYHKDVYLVHTDTIKINIIKVPPPEDWTATYLPLTTESQEDNSPVGYGQGAAGKNTARVINFSAGEPYLPLSTLNSPPLLIGAENEFKLKVDFGRELANPTLPVANINNGRGYPLVNIGYVLINKDYNDYVKSSG